MRGPEPPHRMAGSVVTVVEELQSDKEQQQRPRVTERLTRDTMLPHAAEPGRREGVWDERKDAPPDQVSKRAAPRLPIVTLLATAGEPQAFGQRRRQHQRQDDEIELGKFFHAQIIMSIAQ